MQQLIAGYHLYNSRKKINTKKRYNWLVPDKISSKAKLGDCFQIQVENTGQLSTIVTVSVSACPVAGMDYKEVINRVSRPDWLTDEMLKAAIDRQETETGIQETQQSDVLLNEEIAQQAQYDLSEITTSITSENLEQRLQELSRLTWWIEKCRSLAASDPKREMPVLPEGRQAVPQAKKASEPLAPTVLPQILAEKIAGEQSAPPQQSQSLPKKAKDDPQQELYLATEVLTGYLLTREKSNYTLTTVPENVARAVGLTHGDLVCVEEKESLPKESHSFRYLLTIVDHKSLPATMERFTQGVVEIRDKHYCIEKNVNGEALDEPYIVPEKAVSVYDLMEGDIVDLRWEPGKSFQKRLFWKHKIAPPIPIRVKEPEETIPQKAEASESYDHTSKITEGIPGISGLTVGCIGMSAKTSEFRKMVENSGAKLILIDKKSARPKEIAVFVKKADLIVIAIQGVSHNQSGLAVKMAKKQNKPHEKFNGFSPLGFQQAVISALEKKKYIDSHR
ncbi:DUF2325 domain-containing protein [Candidatus Enterococcus leclercqii]|uniref:DUF2325 domain-containing protein n=1 Tax=Candidatus Enterococcus leclercqii TaxID=1857218 RepID=UPI001379C2AC|nr:DUF2325 domain-containing protein [Enterococcus sp. CU9D]KAF1294178.1 hypothetical protein BAU14_07255 [Enterococcus sp. CU9D]